MRIFKWLSIFLAVSLNSHAQTFVQIKFGGEANRNSKKHFIMPLEDGSFLFGNTTKVQTNEEGIIDLKLNLKNPGIVIFSNPDIDIIEIYVEPNKRVRMNVDQQVTFSGDLAVENGLLRSFRRNGVAHALGQKYLPQQVVTLRESSTTKEFLDSLDNFIARDQQKIDQAVKSEKKISP